MYRISRLAREFGLSRSTLLYYDRIGLLRPSGRTGSGHRVYSRDDRIRLDTICMYRRAGLTIKDIGALLSRKGDDDTEAVLKRRLTALGNEIRAMQSRQRLLARMLRISAEGGPRGGVDRDAWVAMLRVAGMDDDAMNRWHAEFERRSPEAHHRFLASLGMDDREVLLVRGLAAGQSGSKTCRKRLDKEDRP
jgi:DNA-binding transcriptional MerR regulator